MITSTQALILTFVLLIFLYIIVDRICKCIERTKNPLSGVEGALKIIKGMSNSLKDENGDKSL